MIDDIYRKERTYIPSYDKDNILCERSAIFQLENYHNLRCATIDEEHKYSTAQPVKVENYPSQLHLIKPCEIHEVPTQRQLTTQV